MARHGEREAFVTDRYRLDYAKLDRVADRLAGHLHRLGVARGDRVVLFLPNDREFVYALLASWRLGAVAVPVNVREQRPELAFILAQCAAKAIVFDASLADRLPSPAAGLPLAVRISAGPSPGATTLDELLETRSPAAPAADPGEEEPACDPLHLGDDRPAEGRDAHASQPDPLGAALPDLHATHRRRPVAARGAGEPRHRPRRDHPRDVRGRRVRDRDARVQGTGVSSSSPRGSG